MSHLLSQGASSQEKFSIGGWNPVAKSLANTFRKAEPPPPPGPPNPNDAANAARQLTDQMRMRRGLLANIYAGGQPQAPTVGKSQLGT